MILFICSRLTYCPPKIPPNRLVRVLKTFPKIPPIPAPPPPPPPPPPPNRLPNMSLNKFLLPRVVRNFPAILGTFGTFGIGVSLLLSNLESNGVKKSRNPRSCQQQKSKI